MLKRCNKTFGAPSIIQNDECRSSMNPTIIFHLCLVSFSAEVIEALAKCRGKFFGQLRTGKDVQELIHSLLESGANWVTTKERRFCVRQRQKVKCGENCKISGKPDEVVMVGVEGKVGLTVVCVGEVKLKLIPPIQTEDKEEMRDQWAEFLQLLAAMTAGSERQGGAISYGVLTDLFLTFFVTLATDGTIEVTCPSQLTKSADMLTLEQRVEFLKKNLRRSETKMSGTETGLEHLVKHIYAFVKKSAEDFVPNRTSIHIATPEGLNVQFVDCSQDICCIIGSLFRFQHIGKF